MGGIRMCATHAAGVNADAHEAYGTRHYRHNPRRQMTIPTELQSALVEAVAEELSLGGDAGSVVACMRDTLANEGYEAEFVGFPED